MLPLQDPTRGLSQETVRQYNSRLMDILSLYMNLMPTAIDRETVCEVARDCSISNAEAFAYCLAALMGLDAGGADRHFFQHWLLPSIKECDPLDYTGDAYFQSIRIPSDVRGRWQLREEELAPFEPFVRNDIVVMPDRRMIPQIGFFKAPYRFPAVLEKGREWMTLQPNEIATTRPAIEKAHGRVLTFGLGLGYFTYHAAQKPEVESVTAVDISGEVIDLFSTHILPQFPHKEKVRLVQADALDFAEQQMAGNFDFVFADIWHDAGDGKELYLKMKPYEARFPTIDFSFWLEDTIRCYLDESLWEMRK